MHAKEDAGDHLLIDNPFIREYKGGRVERLLHSPFVRASEDAAANRGVATRDVVIDRSTGLSVSVRLFFPSHVDEKLPVILYFHGGSFCAESAFCRTYTSYAKSLAARARAIVVSVEYHLAPEHPIPAAYDDAWAALKWVSSLSDPWLADYADPERTILAGDSAGGNIAYHTAVRASRDGSLVDIDGLVMVEPFFWSSHRLASEAVWDGVAMFPPTMVDILWPFVTAGRGSNDDPRIDPPEEEIASLTLTCRRALVAVAERDSLRDRGRRVATRMRDCAWDVTMVESEGEDHGFHLYHPLRATSRKLMESIAQFVNQPRGWEGNAQPILGVPARPYIDVFGYGMTMKHWGGPNSTTRSSLHIGHGKTSRRKQGLCLGTVRPKKASNVASLSTAAPGYYVIKNFL